MSIVDEGAPVAMATPRSTYPWRLFWLLVAAGTLATALVVPYQLTLQPTLVRNFELPVLYASAIGNSAILLVVAVGLGLRAARATGLRVPFLEALLYRGDRGAALRALGLPTALAFGAAVGFAIVALELLGFRQLITLPTALIPRPSAFDAFLASFYGGITEELLTRLFLVSGFAWLFGRFVRRTDARPARLAFWLAIVTSALIFGALHLPATAVLMSLTPVVVLRALVLNGLGGVVFGWLFWRRGLEAAMVAHFAADVALHVVPALLQSG